MEPMILAYTPTPDYNTVFVARFLDSIAVLGGSSSSVALRFLVGVDANVPSS